ncbi:nSTAND1 domain-containing NTPase [Streptomyces sp. HD]|uniref:nSTAND1 domain-containing NTPase n=1 Tax=Streptomyces sp. HD TaxID=3020892 RepID=UPI0023309C58|nr:trypsin-like peptidase domain-containing protein [Streptomyces sp. HD]MDC0771779.1 trypsin-like peptidase domain-containing protein [Streptomyces sp. HD]
MTARFPEALGPAVARLRGPDGRTVGTGFLLAPGTVATCAHVVADALRTDARDGTAPTLPVTVEFPLQRGSAVYEASVSAWCPVAPDGSGDIALLRLPEQPAPEPTEVPVPSATPGGPSPVPLAGVGDVWDHRFRILGFPATAEHGAWIGGRLRGAVGQGWISMEADGTAYRITPGCSGAPVWDEESGAVVGMTVATDRGPDSVTAYLIPAEALLALQPGRRGCPYRGLDAFREEDAEQFFGREEETERLLDAVDRHIVVPVVGPSGSGKTSLVRAGVLPRLRARGHTVSEIRPLPGTRASLTLARALIPVLEPGLGTAEQERGALALADLLDSEGGPSPADLGLRLLDHCGPSGHVLFLNQLEETVATEPATARALLGLVVSLVSAPADGRRLRVLATLRSASLDGLADPATARVLSDCAQVVAPLGRAGLLRAVEGPAGTVPGLTLEPGLAERVVDDAQDEPGHLPMVEFALTELWSRERGIRLTHAGYEALGGVAGALSGHAEKRVGRVIAAHGEAPVRRLFTQLARPDDTGGFTRKPVRLALLSPELRAAAEALATGTHLVRITHGPDDDPIVDLAHEELVRSWDRLGEWLDESRVFRAWQERLLQALAHWKETGGESGALLRGSMLATSVESLEDPDRRADISPAERDYVQLSRRHQQRGLRRWRLATAVMVVLALVAGCLAVSTWLGRMALEEQVRTAASRRLVEDAARLAPTDPGMAARLSVAAWHNAPGKDARQALLQAYLGGMSVISVHGGQGAEPISSIDVTPDGSTAVTTSASRDGVAHARVWTGLSDGRASSWSVPGLTGGEAPVRAEFSDDGGLLAIVTADGAVHCYDVRAHRHLWTGHQPVLGTGRMGHTAAIDFSDSGRLLLRLVADDLAEPGAAHSSHVQVWQSRTGKPRKTSQQGLPSGREANDAALVREGRDVVYLSRYEGHGKARVQNLATGRDQDTVPDAEWLSHRGAGVVRDRGHGWHQLRRLTGSGGVTGQRFLAVEPEGSDLTGRYAQVRNGTQVSPYEVVDVETGRRYRVPGFAWRATGEEQPVGVLPGEKAGAAPRILVASGSDLMVLRTREERSMPLPDPEPGFESGEGPSYTRSRGGEYRAHIHNDGSNDTTTVTLVVARRGEESRAEPVTLKEFNGEAQGFFTTDGDHLVVWGDDKVAVVDPDSPQDMRVWPSPGTVTVVPLQDSEVAVLEDRGLVRYDVASGEETVLDEHPCGELGLPCRGLAVRPGRREEVAVGHSNGELVIWNTETRQARRETGITVADTGGGRGWVGWVYLRSLEFDPRGRTVATPLDSRTIQRWDVETGERVGPAVETDGKLSVVALADDGSLLLAVDGGLSLWRPGDREPYVTLPFSAVPDGIHVTAGHVTFRHGNSELSIPLDPEAWHKALCRHWTPYTREESAILDGAGAVKDSPCL